MLLTKEDRNELKELSQLKEQLSQKEDFLEQLAETKDSVSAERYEQLETSYRESIDTLSETIKNLTERYRHKQDESKIQLSSLEKRREKTAGEQKEITLLREKKAISEDDFKNQNSDFSKQLNRLDKEINILKIDLEEIDFYLNAKGDVKFKRSILEQYDVLPPGAAEKVSSKAKGLFDKLFNKKIIILALIIVLVPLFIIFLRQIGSKVPEGMVFVEGGTFQMGSTDGFFWERPVHEVTVSDFYIGKYEVTQKEWVEIMGINPSSFKGDNLPVERVSWYDAIEFCNKLSIREGLTPVYSINGNPSASDWSSGTIVADWTANGYRLPTESEWEYAARGGNKSRGFIYSGSNNIDDVAWYNDNSGNRTHDVGTKQPNELGIYDMSGNVWEWCWDWWGNYTSSAKTNPRGPNSGSNRVLRGGSCYNHADSCSVSNRNHGHPALTYYHIGFRVCRVSP